MIQISATFRDEIIEAEALRNLPANKQSGIVLVLWLLSFETVSRKFAATNLKRPPAHGKSRTGVRTQTDIFDRTAPSRRIDDIPTTVRGLAAET